MKFNTFIAGMVAGTMITFYMTMYSINKWEIYFIPMFVLAFLGIVINLYVDEDEELTQKIEEMK